MENFKKTLLATSIATVLAACSPSDDSNDPEPQGSNGGEDTEEFFYSHYKAKELPENDPTCPNGGIEVEAGFDTDKSGILEADEITYSEKVCHGEDGEDGEDGVNASIDVALASESQCPSGGHVISLFDATTNKDVVLCNGIQGDPGDNSVGGMSYDFTAAKEMMQGFGDYVKGLEKLGRSAEQLSDEMNNNQEAFSDLYDQGLESAVDLAFLISEAAQLVYANAVDESYSLDDALALGDEVYMDYEFMADPNYENPESSWHNFYDDYGNYIGEDYGYYAEVEKTDYKAPSNLVPGSAITVTKSGNTITVTDGSVEFLDDDKTEGSEMTTTVSISSTFDIPDLSASYNVSNPLMMELPTVTTSNSQAAATVPGLSVKLTPTTNGSFVPDNMNQRDPGDSSLIEVSFGTPENPIQVMNELADTDEDKVIFTGHIGLDAVIVKTLSVDTVNGYKANEHIINPDLITVHGDITKGDINGDHVSTALDITFDMHNADTHKAGFELSEELQAVDAGGILTDAAAIFGKDVTDQYAESRVYEDISGESASAETLQSLQEVALAIQMAVDPSIGTDVPDLATLNWGETFTNSDIGVTVQYFDGESYYDHATDEDKAAYKLAYPLSYTDENSNSYDIYVEYYYDINTNEIKYIGFDAQFGFSGNFYTWVDNDSDDGSFNYRHDSVGNRYIYLKVDENGIVSAQHEKYVNYTQTYSDWGNNYSEDVVVVNFDPDTGAYETPAGFQDVSVIGYGFAESLEGGYFGYHRIHARDKDDDLSTIEEYRVNSTGSLTSSKAEAKEEMLNNLLAGMYIEVVDEAEARIYDDYYFYDDAQGYFKQDVGNLVMPTDDDTGVMVSFDYAVEDLDVNTYVKRGDDFTNYTLNVDFNIDGLKDDDGNTLNLGLDMTLDHTHLIPYQTSIEMNLENHTGKILTAKYVPISSSIDVLSPYDYDGSSKVFMSFGDNEGGRVHFNPVDWESVVTDGGSEDYYWKDKSAAKIYYNGLYHGDLYIESEHYWYTTAYVLWADQDQTIEQIYHGRLFND